METPEKNSAQATSEEDLVEVRKPTSLLIAQFFLFPLIIIAICAGIFLLVGNLAYEMRTAEQYLSGIRSGSETQRWQAAWELANLVKTNPKEMRSPEFIGSLISVYKESPDADIRVRGFVASMLGLLQEPSVVPTLLEGLRREERLKTADWREGMLRPSLSQIQENLIESQISTLLALGSIGDNAAVPGVLEHASSPDPDVRKAVAYALGSLKDPEAIPTLRVLLNDVKEDVQWNAAMALARLNNSEGAELLMKLTDLTYTTAMPGMTSELRTRLRVNAVVALGILKHEPARQLIEMLSETDPDLAVRYASLEALKKFG
jgi:HEAT repeat protein